jgi:hypothetical protein
MSDTLEALKRITVADPDKEIARRRKELQRQLMILDLKEHVGLVLIKAIGLSVFGGLVWIILRLSR